MKNPRRLFLSQVSVMAGIAATSKPLTSLASVSKHIYTLHSGEHTVAIYHTAWLNGRLDAVHEEMGGLAQIKTALSKQETDGLVLDAGGFLNKVSDQQTIIKAMNAAGYHAAAIGHKEMANGQEYLAKLIPMMKFKAINCNYGFEGDLKKLISPYITVTTGRFKVGITGVGQKVAGVRYNDAIESANNIARLLKEDEKCDLVICMSALGNKQDNQILAATSEHIDMIIGGQTGKLTAEPLVLRNKLKSEVILAQTAANGLLMGKTNFSFDGDKQKNGLAARYVIPGQPMDKTYAASITRLKEKVA